MGSELERDIQTANRFQWFFMVVKNGTIEEIRETFDRLYGDRETQ